MQDNRKVFKVKRLVTETKEYIFDIMARDKETVEKELEKSLNGDFNQIEYVNNQYDNGASINHTGQDVGRIVQRSFVTEIQ